MIFVGWPMLPEIVEEGGPIVLQRMSLEIAQGKREAVIDADERRSALGEPPDQPFGNPASCPIFAARWRRINLDRDTMAFCHVDAQARQAGGRRGRA